jgi:hypothetical protein
MMGAPQADGLAGSDGDRKPSASALSGSIPSAWKCGHPRTIENTKIVRAGTGTACKECFREHNRKYLRRKRAGQRYDAAALTGFANRFSVALSWLDQNGKWTIGPTPWTISNALVSARRNGLVASRNKGKGWLPVNDWKLTPLGLAVV